MKKVMLTLLFTWGILSASGCVYSRSYDRNGEGRPIEAAVEAGLTAQQTEICALNLENDTKAVLRYTYSTDDKEGAVLGYYNPSAPESAAIELLPATEEAYNAVWTEESIELEKGETVFYLTGDGVHCKMILQIQGVSENPMTDSHTARE